MPAINIVMKQKWVDPRTGRWGFRVEALITPPEQVLPIPKLKLFDTPGGSAGGGAIIFGAPNGADMSSSTNPAYNWWLQGDMIQFEPKSVEVIARFFIQQKESEDF